MSRLAIIPHATVIVRDGIIEFVGPTKDAPSHSQDESKVIDAEGRVILPGFIDSHTHLIFGGYRPDEFSWRMSGESYMSIMQRGGGIQSTVNATRHESCDNLIAKARWFIDRMSEMGVTTVEAKSGYGLDTESELKMLEAIHRLATDPDRKLDVVSTFLGAHAVPKEYKDNTEGYVNLMINEMIPAAKGKQSSSTYSPKRMYLRSTTPTVS